MPPAPDSLGSLVTVLAPWALLLGAGTGLAFTVNAFVPIRHSKWLVVPSTLASMFVAELAGYHLLWQAAVVGGLVAVGGLGHWAGWVGLACAAVGWIGLVVLVVEGRRAAVPVAAALADLGSVQARPVPWRKLLVPFPLRLDRARVVRNVVYASVSGQRLRLDVYLPARAFAAGEARRPAVVQIHGGAWVVGDKREQGVPLLTHLSDRGFVGFNVNYRLSPSATYPDHLVDIKRAIAWIRGHADEYGVDPGFIAVTGGSAGGHLAAMAALTNGEVRFQPGFEDADTSVQAAVPFYAIYDLVDAHHRHAPGFAETLLEPMVLKAFRADAPDLFADASPITHVRADAPPFFVIHGDRDSMAPLADAREFVAALRSVSTQPVLYAELHGAQHSFDVFVSPRSLPVVEGVSEFLESIARAHAERAAASRLP